MSRNCEIIINPELSHNSFSQFTPIRPTHVHTDMQSGNNAYSGTFKQSSPRVVKLLNIELDRETDGRWIAEIPQIPGVMVYGSSRENAVAEVRKLALNVLADDEKDSHEAFGVRHTFLIEHAA
jgi:predicted RNase H-like HicB family nuclease